MEQGTGKTKVIIDNFSHLYYKGYVDAVFVIAPNGVHRNWINDEIPKHMPDAVIASEDRRFYDHWGLSLRSVARAIGINILSLSYRQGFSTLTQQLARNLYKTIGFEDSILRKIKEVITAVQIERTYTKDEILEMYLNLSLIHI